MISILISVLVLNLDSTQFIVFFFSRKSQCYLPLEKKQDYKYCYYKMIMKTDMLNVFFDFH